MPRSARARPTLTADLRSRSDAALASLLTARPDLALPVPGDLAGLASRATTRSSILRAVDSLDSACLQVLDALLVADDGASIADLRALLGEGSGPDPGEPDPVIDALAKLYERALIWGGGAKGYTVVRTMREIAGHYPAGLGPSYALVLAGLPPHRLELIAHTIGLDITSGANSEAILRRLSRKGEIARLVEAVAEREPDALGPLRDMTWGPPVGSMAAALRPIDPEDITGPVETLLAYGLLVATSPHTVVLPLEVGMLLRGGRIHEATRLREPVLQIDARSPKVVADTAAGAAAAAVAHVETLLDTWGLSAPPVLRAGGLAVRDLRAAATLLGVDEAEVALLAELAHGAGLSTRVRAGKVRDAEEWLPTPAYDLWRRRPVADRWVVLARVWLTTSRLPGLAGQRDERDRRLAALGPDLDRVAAPGLRGAVLDLLAEVPEGKGAAAESVAAVVDWRGPRRGGALHASIVEWTLREAARLGMTGLGALSPFGRALIRDEAAAAEVLDVLLPDPVDHVLLQADLTAVAPGPLVPDVAQELALAAEVESTGGATVYRFTPASVRRALDAGRGAADIHAMLAKYSRTPVPQPLTYLIDDVARRHGRVRVVAVSAVIRSDDEAMTDTLLGDRGLAELGLRRIAPTVLITSAKADHVVDALRAAGHAPVAETGSGEVVLRRPDARRAPATRRPSRVTGARPADDVIVAAAIRAMRAGERALAARPSTTVLDPLDDAALLSTMDVIEVLQRAVELGTPMWVSYLDNDGVSSERVIDPLRISGGWLTAYDHLRESVRTFVVHRIMAISAAPAGAFLDPDTAATP